MADWNQWSSIKSIGGSMPGMGWMPADDQDRVLAYIKYDQMYWNDPRQYSLRVLDGEQPLYIPNARTVVDTTAHYLLKGLTLTAENASDKKQLDDFLKREAFYSRFAAAKVTGVARGDFVFHMTANPKKQSGSRISLNSVEPGSVFPIWDPDMPSTMIGCHLATLWENPDDPYATYMRRLTYRIDESTGQRRISRVEVIIKIDNNQWTPKAEIVKTTLPFGFLDPRIDQIPIFWFQNRHWDGEDFGSSDLRGLEAIMMTVSQGATDVTASLALEGLGVYATDGGRPVIQNADGTTSETDWEVAPGRVMEVPSGAYFRRVEGVGSITPAVDQITYLEDKIHEATGLGQVALGTLDPVSAASGIALSIKFLPTLAKIETRDQQGIDILTQLFYNWKTWMAVFEQVTISGDIVPSIGDKLPTDRVAKLNELNNMKDRNVISAEFYRQEMEKLGYKFPSDIATQIQADIDAETAAKKAAQPDPAPQQNSPGDVTSTDGSTLPVKNESNNAKKPNESSGTEAVNKKTRDA